MMKRYINRFLLTNRMTRFGINLILMISVGSILFNFKVARSQSIPSTPPPAEPASSVPDMLIVRIDSSGQLYVEQNLVTQEQLFQEVLNFNQSVQCGLVVVAASSTTSYSSVVSVIDTLRQAAVQRIALGFPLYTVDSVFSPPISVIVELNQLSPPTIRSLGPIPTLNCSSEQFELPENRRMPLIPVLPEPPTRYPIPIPNLTPPQNPPPSIQR